MKIKNKGVERDIKILTHFKFDTDQDYNTEYVLYTDSEHEGANLYLASVFYDTDKTNFIMPDREKFEDLKKIIENLISNNPNGFIFTQKKYKYIETKIFDTKEIEEVESQHVQLTNTQYKNLINNKYLSYPFSNMLKNKSVKNVKNTKNSMLHIIISSIILILFFGGLLLLEPNISKNLFNLDPIGLIIYTFRIDVLGDAPEIIPSVLIHMGLLTLILAVFSYYYDESKPIMFYILSFIVLFIFNILYFSHISKISINNISLTILKMNAVVVAVNTLILTICYQAFKGITITITDALKVKNFVVHYAVFLILFIVGIIGLMLFYDYNLYEHVLNIIEKIADGGNI